MFYCIVDACSLLINRAVNWALWVVSSNYERIRRKQKWNVICPKHLSIRLNEWCNGVLISHLIKKAISCSAFFLKWSAMYGHFMRPQRLEHIIYCIQYITTGEEIKLKRNFVYRFQSILLSFQDKLCNAFRDIGRLNAAKFLGMCVCVTTYTPRILWFVMNNMLITAGEYIYTQSIQLCVKLSIAFGTYIYHFTRPCAFSSIGI